MKSINPKRNIAVILLISLLLQSCGVQIPVAGSEAKSLAAGGSAPARSSSEVELPLPPGELQVQSAPGTLSNSPEPSFIEAMQVSPPQSSESLSPQQLYDYIHGKGCHITSVEGLVKAYNEAQNVADRLLLHEWLGSYIEWFSEKPIALLDEGQIREYAYLAYTQPRTHEDQTLLRSYLISIFNKIDQNRFGEKHLIRSLSDVLEKINKEAFKDTAELIRIGNVLLGKIIPNETVLTRDNYPTHESILTALHSTLLLISQLDTEGWSDSEDSLYQNFQAKISAIKTASKYYPVTYYSQLLESSLETLKHVDPPTLSQRIDNIFEVVKTVASVYQVARGLLSLEIDLKSWEEAYKKLQDSYTQISTGINQLLSICPESWYNHLLDFISKSMASLDLDGTYKAFEEKLTCIQGLYQDEKDERLLLRYGVTRQLTLTILRDASPSVRKHALAKLKSLTSVWGGDEEIAEALLEGLAAIAKKGIGDTVVNARDFLSRLHRDSQPAEANVSAKNSSVPRWPFRYCFALPRVNGDSSHAQQPEGTMATAMRKWLGGKTLEQKLETHLPSVSPLGGKLFSKVQKDLGVKLDQRIQAAPPPILSEEELRTTLKKSYQDHNFTDMPSFLGGPSMSVKDLACHLKLNEQKKVDKKESQDQLAQREERLQWVKTPIELKDLFKKRSLKPDNPAQEINKILLIGEAGTGKTSLTKKLAHDWSVENWGQELTAVYVLPVRALKADKYDNEGNYRTDNNLSTAIANECFTSTPEEQSFKALRERIKRSLEQPTTLLILDGLDEQHGASECILKEAKSGKHKLLLTSRLYGIEKERELVDIEVDHMGLNESQRNDFVSRRLDTPGSLLLHFIDSHRLSDMSLIPVNLVILCSLWKNKSEKLKSCGILMSLPTLYRELVYFVWERFEFKNESESRVWGYRYAEEVRDKLFKDLENIAFDGLEKGLIIFSQNSLKELLRLGRRSSELLATSFFLRNIDSSDQDTTNPRCQFPHLTFQEYFAGRSLANNLVQVFEQGNSTSDKSGLVKFLSENKYVPRYRKAFMFMSGEVFGARLRFQFASARKEERLGLIKYVLKLVDLEPREIIGVQHLGLQLRILDEWLLTADNEQEVKEELEELEKDVKLDKLTIDWFNKGLKEFNANDNTTSWLLYTLVKILAETRLVSTYYSKSLWSLLQNTIVGDSKVRASTYMLEILLENNFFMDKQEIQKFLRRLKGIVESRDESAKTAIKACAYLVGRGISTDQILDIVEHYWGGNKKPVDCSHRHHAAKALTIIMDREKDEKLRRNIVDRLLKYWHFQKESYSMWSPVSSWSLPYDTELLINLLKRGLFEEEILPILEEALRLNRDNSGDIHTRSAVARSFVPLAEKLGVDRMLPLLKEALGDSHPEVRCMSVKALSHLINQSGLDSKQEEILQLLKEASEDNNDDVKTAALSCLPERKKEVHKNDQRPSLNRGKLDMERIKDTLHANKYSDCRNVMGSLPDLIKTILVKSLSYCSKF